MADQIGDFTLHAITDYTISGSKVTLNGYFRTRAEFDQLWEMCRKAEGNVAVNGLVGDRQVGFDVTEDSVLTYYCQFDDEKLLDGWYMIMGLGYPQRHLHDYWPFSLTLFLMGTDAVLIAGFYLSLLEDEENDWGI